MIFVAVDGSQDQIRYEYDPWPQEVSCPIYRFSSTLR